MASKNNNQFDVEELDLDELPEGFEEIPEPEPIKDLNVISEKREDTRGKLSLFFLGGFFIVLIVGMVVAALDEGNKVNSVKEILLVVSGILSGPLGFVIGYYFRSREEE